MNQEIEIYIGWIPENLDIPKRSRLVNLEPIALGTAMGECLTSYITRLAEAHSVSVVQLFKNVIVPLMQKYEADTTSFSLENELSTNGQDIVLYKSQSWNGLTKWGKSLVKAVEALTMYQNLDRLTFIPWGNVIAHQNLFREKKSWCPRCFELWKKEGRVLYEPIIWMIRENKICYIHKSTLEDKCNSCGKNQTYLTFNSRIGYCSNCQNWLGRKGEELEPVPNNAPEIATTNIIGELISYIPRLEQYPSREGLRRLIIKIIDTLFVGNSAAFAHVLDMNPIVIGNWRSGKHRITLYRLMKLHKCVGISPIKLLLGSVISKAEWKTAKTIVKEKFKSSEFSFELRENNQNRGNAILRELNIALTQTPPPSLDLIAKKLGVQSKSLYLNYSDVCKKITARHIKFYGRVNSINSVFYKKPLNIAFAREILDSELKKAKPKPLTQIATENGFFDHRTIKRLAPDLYEQVKEKRKLLDIAESEKEAKRIYGFIKKALSETSPPPLKEVAHQAGFNNCCKFKRLFPKECKKIVERYAGYRKIRDLILKDKLLEALQENPPPTNMELSKRLGYRDSASIHFKFPEVCYQITERHRKYVIQCKEEREKEFRSQIKSIVIDLQKQGLHPSEGRVKPRLVNPPSRSWSLFKKYLDEIKDEFGIANR